MTLVTATWPTRCGPIVTCPPPYSVAIPSSSDRREAGYASGGGCEARQITEARHQTQPDIRRYAPLSSTIGIRTKIVLLLPELRMRGTG